MSRPKRILRKRFVIFCEGDTEYNYIDHMRKNQGVELSLKPVNMEGGGYSNFLKTVKTSANNNCLAKFIIIDADRARDDDTERNNLKSLIDFCSLQNKKGLTPHFLVLNGPDFEYIACLHDPGYKGQNTETYIKRAFHFQSLDDFKAYDKVYQLLNSDDRSYEHMLNHTRRGKRIMEHVYAISKTTFDIRISKALYQPQLLWERCSNIFEFFDVIDW